MPGTFTIGEKKIRPGGYHRYENRGAPSTASAVNGIGAALFRSNWGPLNKVVTLDLTSDVAAEFGNGQTVDVLTELFNGGCTEVQAVRIGNGGTAATITLKDTTPTDEEAGTAPVDAVTISAKYVGDRPFSVSIRDSLTGDYRECVFYEGTREFEKVTFTPGGDEAQTLVDALKSSVNFIGAKAASATALPLAEVTQQQMTAGTNPAAVVEDYSTGFSTLEATKWNVVVVDTEDSSIHALLQAFLQRVYLNGGMPMACITEKASDELDLETRMGRAAAYNDEKICYVLNSAVDSTGKVYEGYPLAARIGGMIAAIPSSDSLTHEVIGGFVGLNEALTNSQINKALTMGCLCLTLNATKQVWVESGINTLVTPSADQDDGWKKIRRTKTRFELMDRIGVAIDSLTGNVNNDNNGRGTVISAGQNVINEMNREGKIADGGNFYLDSKTPPAGDEAWFVIDVDDIDTLEKIYLTYRFRFSVQS